MSQLSLLLISTVIVVSTGEDDKLTEIYKSMGIIPNYLDKSPVGFIRVVYQNIVAENDIELTPTQTKDPPTVEWTAAVRTYYTLVFVNPNSPDPANPHLKEWLHWLIVNIPGTDLDQGDTICPYVPIFPPKDVGFMHYLFFIFQQTDYMFFDEPHLNNSATEGHEHFDTMKFATKYALGHPVASTTFKAQWDEYASIVRKELNVAV